MAKRGRPSRTDTIATKRVELRLTLDELRAVRRLASANETTVADMLRLAVLEIAAEMGEPPPLLLGRRVLRRIVAGSNSRRGSPSKHEK